MYALFMLFATLALWLQVRAIRRGRVVDFALWGLAAAALMWTQYFAVLFVGAQQLGFLAALARRGTSPERRRRLARGWQAGLALAVVAVLPVLPFALDQFSANEAAGKGFGGSLPSQAGASASQNEGLAQPSVYSAITNVLWAVGGYHSDATMTGLAALWPLGVLGALAALGRERSSVNRLLVACALLPMVGLFVLGQVKPFVFEVRYFSAAVPVALLLMARASTAWTPRARLAAATATVLVALLGLAVADQQLNSSNPRQYDFRGATERIGREARPGDIVVLSPPYVASVVSYYGEDGLRVRSAAAGVPAPRRGQRVFVLGSFFDKRQYADLTHRAVRRLRGEARLADQFRVPQVRVWEFTR